MVCIDSPAAGRMADAAQRPPADRIAANEDFNRFESERRDQVRLIAMDTFTGQIRGSRAFALQSGVVPGNIAALADGTLV